eukprot:1452930-Rhodomonas_salina.1
MLSGPGSDATLSVRPGGWGERSRDSRMGRPGPPEARPDRSAGDRPTQTARELRTRGWRREQLRDAHQTQQRWYRPTAHTQATSLRNPRQSQCGLAGLFCSRNAVSCICPERPGSCRLSSACTRMRLTHADDAS